MKHLYETTIMRKKDVLRRLGISNSTLYVRIAEGLVPPSIPLGPRSVGWLSHEIDYLIASMASSLSGEELKKAVQSMIEARQELKGDVA